MKHPAGRPQVENPAGSSSLTLSLFMIELLLATSGVRASIISSGVGFLCMRVELVLLFGRERLQERWL
jgi:hypothetical protein